MEKNKGNLKATKWTVSIQAVLIIISFVVSLLGGDTMNDAIVQAGWCVTGDAICVLGCYGKIVAFFLGLALVYDLSIKYSIILKTSNFFTILKPKALHIRVGSLHGRIFTLKFKNTEWRFPFKKMYAHVTVPSMLRVTILKNLEWRESQTTSSVFIKRFKSYEINFIRIDPENNKFYIITNSDKNPEFGIGEYSFDIGSSVNIFGNFKVKDNMFLSSTRSKTMQRKQYIIVKYEGGKKISAKLAKEEPAKKVSWFNQYAAEPRVHLTGGIRTQK